MIRGFGRRRCYRHEQKVERAKAFQRRFNDELDLGGGELKMSFGFRSFFRTCPLARAGKPVPRGKLLVPA
jgi:hypothetical protein